MELSVQRQARNYMDEKLENWGKWVVGIKCFFLRISVIFSKVFTHDDVITSKKAFHITGPLWGESVDHRWILLIKGRWCGPVMFPWMLARLSCGTNGRVAVDLRRRDDHVASQQWKHFTKFNCEIMGFLYLKYLAYVLTFFTVTSQWVSWGLKLPPSRLFAQPFI